MPFELHQLAHGLGAALPVLLALTWAPWADGATATHKVRMFFNVGPVDIELYENESPLHVANFLTYVDAGDYDESFIHRTRAFNPNQPLNHDLFIQGGSFKLPIGDVISDNPITPRSPVPNEFDAANGLTNSPGSLAAARTANPDSATSGWFINQSNNSASFDSGPYTVFGQVTSGMHIIDQIPFLPNHPSFEGTQFESMPLINQQFFIYIDRVERIPLVTGDYDLNGTVNQGDFNTWSSRFGTTHAAADGNSDGVVDAADYTVWRDHLAATQASGAGLASLPVPEPAAAVLGLFAIPWVWRLARRK